MWAFIFAIPSDMRKSIVTVVHAHLYCDSGVQEKEFEMLF